MRCEFCSILARDDNCDTVGVKRVLRSDLMLKDSFILMADFSPIYPGHYLLLSKECKTKMLDNSKATLKEYFLTLKYVVKKLKITGDYIIYEHGGAKCKNNGCQDHAHTHIVPISNTSITTHIFDELNSFGFDSRPLDLSSIPSTEYLHFLSKTDLQSEQYGTIYRNDYKIPSALIRSIINIYDEKSGLEVNQRSSREKSYFEQTENQLIRKYA